MVALSRQVRGDPGDYQFMLVSTFPLTPTIAVLQSERLVWYDSTWTVDVQHRPVMGYAACYRLLRLETVQQRDRLFERSLHNPAGLLALSVL